jgi:hypothetical protein
MSSSTLRELQLRSWRSVARGSPRIFISHAREDRAVVGEIAEELRALGFTP